MRVLSIARVGPEGEDRTSIEHAITFIESGLDTGVSENSGTPESSILIGFSIINHPIWGTPIFGNTHTAHTCILACVEILWTYFNVFKPLPRVFKMRQRWS